ncbi:MAG TPA: ferritin family protein [Candidatus Omnitrophota bacterium]|nr:ferritin family protein [Candidatus Omnitrophota bacterium]
MGNIFAGSEIVEIGIQIEKNGRDFYNTLEKKSKNQRASEMFKYLAGEEEKHIKIFQEILDKTEKYEPIGLYADEYFAYMNALASEYVFTKENKGEEIAKTMKSDKEAVNMGIGFEKDSIIFYEGMKKAVPEYDLKIVDELIMQEQRHLRILSDLKKDLI